MTSGIWLRAAVTAPVAIACGDELFITSPSLDVITKSPIFVGILRW